MRIKFIGLVCGLNESIYIQMIVLCASHSRFLTTIYSFSSLLYLGGLFFIKGREGLGQKETGGEREGAMSTTKHPRFPVLSHMQHCKMTYSPENVGRTLSIDHAFQAYDVNAFWLSITGNS